MAQTASKFAMEKFIADIKADSVPKELEYLKKKAKHTAMIYNSNKIDIWVIRNICSPKDIVRLIGTYKHKQGQQLKLL